MNAGVSTILKCAHVAAQKAAAYLEDIKITFDSNFYKLGVSERKRILNWLERSGLLRFLIDKDGELIPTAYGTSTSKGSGGENWTHWALYSINEIEAYAKQFEKDELFDMESEDFINGLTGWTKSYSGPGKAFHDKPFAEVYRNRVLIKQYGGLDI